MTDLFSAYSQPEQLNVNEFDFDKRVKNVEYSPDVEVNSRENIESINQNSQQKQVQPSKSVIYDQGELLQNINDENIKQQMNILKKELEAEKRKKQIEYKENYEKTSLIDSFMKKKKEMLRFFSLSLIIIFALSLHDIFTLYIKEYIDSTNLTENKEILTRFAYPLGIFIIAWILKTMKH